MRKSSWIVTLYTPSNPCITSISVDSFTWDGAVCAAERAGWTKGIDLTSGHKIRAERRG